jgi:aspartate/methionine/tyrosine aminotransferase
MTYPRLPADLTPNEITALLEEKRRSGETILDLTETNPTKAGLAGAGPTELQALADPRGAVYEPCPRGLPAARDAIAGYYEERGRASQGGSARQGPAADPRDLILVASTSEAYAHLFRLLCEPGSEVLVPRPSYPLFEPLAALEGVRVEHYRLAYDERWRLDLDSLEGALSPRTRAVVLVQPNNPTGSCLSAEETAAVVSLCAERGIAIISDEVFGDFPWPPSMALLPTLLGERRALTFVLSGLSKLCGMPQMKVAWIAVSGPEVAKQEALQGLEWIADLFLSVSTPVQIAIPTLLQARGRFQAAVRRRLEANLARLHALGNQDGGWRLRGGEGGWSAVLLVPPLAGDLALEALRKHNVLVHPGHFYNTPPDGSVVVGLLAEPAIFAKGIDLLTGLA